MPNVSPQNCVGPIRRLFPIFKFLLGPMPNLLKIKLKKINLKKNFIYTDLKVSNESYSLLPCLPFNLFKLFVLTLFSFHLWLNKGG